MNVREPSVETVLAGGGQMGELMRSIDWAATPLGPVSDWPQSLRTTLSILLTSRAPIFLWWGPELVQFYNDAYRPILGTEKHLGAMGRRGRETWAEIWHIIGPMIEDVFAGGSTSVEDGLLVLNRSGYLEEGYFNYAYSPIRGEGGAVDGVFCVCAETTAKVIGERRLRTLMDLASRASRAETVEEACRVAAETLAANPWDVPFATLYLYSSDRTEARLAASCGIATGTFISPETLTLQDGGLLPALAREGRAERLDVSPYQLEPMSAVWPEPPVEAQFLPVTLTGSEQPIGFAILGASARKRLDEDYRNFQSLVGSHLASAIAEALAFQEERQRAEALAEVDRAKTQFFSNVSHEFRTPLTLILGPLEDTLSTHSDGLPAEFRAPIETVHRNAMRLLRLVNTLLDFSRIEAGRVQASYVPTDLAALTAELASSFRSATDRAGLTLQVDCPDIGEPVWVDRPMWEKVVLNLLSNAFKYTFSGRIEIRLRRAAEDVELVVADTGIGIPQSEIPYIFDRFHRVEGARGRTHEGSGIGLALVRELVRLHGGTVRAASNPGEGSVFIVSVPLGVAHLPKERLSRADQEISVSATVAADAYVEEALRWIPGRLSVSGKDEAVPAPSPVPSTAGHVLVADDNADLRDYLTRLLRGEYRVTTCSNGEEALSAVLRSKPDLVLADVMMPGLDGFGLLARLRSNPETRTIPVILLSARAGEEARTEGMDAGADDYLVKPFNARELLARVGGHLRLAQARKEAEQQAISILESTADAVFMLDAQWRFAYVNRHAAEMIAGGRELRGQVIWEAYPEALNSTFEREYRRAMNERVAVEFEEFYAPLGLWLWVRAYPSASGISVFFQNITERKQTEQALREREERYRLVMQATNEAIWDWNLVTDTVEWNPSIRDRFGFALHEVDPSGSWWKDHIHPEDRAAVLSDISSVIEGSERFWQHEYRFQRADGAYAQVLDRGFVVRAEDGRPVRMIGSMLDVSQLRHMEAALRESEQRFRQLADNISQFAWMANPEGEIFWFNQRWYEYTGTTFEQMHGWGWRKVHHPDHVERVMDQIARAFQSGEPWESTFPLRGKAGEWRWFLSRARPIRNELGVVVRWFGTNTDITEQLQAQQALRESESQFRQIAESMPQLVWVTNPSGYHEWYNQRWYEYTGTTEEEAAGEGWNLFFHPDDQPRAWELWRKSLESGDPYEVEYRCRRYDGVYRWFLGRALPIRDGSGVIVRWFGTCTDIEDQKRTEDELRRANQDLEQFAYSASHDLQEPLRNVAIYSALLQRRYGLQLDAQADRYLAYMVEGAQRMGNLVSDLLSYTRTATVFDTANVRPVDANKVLQTCVNSLQHAIQESNAIVHSGPLPRAVPMNEAHLQQLLQNLIGNAIKYRKDGSEPVRVEVAAEEDDDFWRFCVRDNGIGIAPEHQSRIFGVFTRLHAKGGKYPGTGIGLAICQKIVERYGGRIWVESEEGSGATFCFTVPANVPAIPRQAAG